MNYSEVEAKVREATNDDAWGPHGGMMQEIAQYTFTYEHFPEVMGMLWKRMLHDNKKNWRRVYKVKIVNSSHWCVARHLRSPLPNAWWTVSHHTQASLGEKVCFVAPTFATKLHLAIFVISFHGSDWTRGGTQISCWELQMHQHVCMSTELSSFFLFPVAPVVALFGAKRIREGRHECQGTSVRLAKLRKLQFYWRIRKRPRTQW